MASLAHVGVVVVDLERAMSELSVGLGVEWTEPQVRQNGPVRLRVAFSREAPYIELIEGQPGSSWDTSKGPHLQHLAYWTDEFAEDKRRLADAGSVLEQEGVAPFGGAWSYHHVANGGFRIELCDSAGRDAFFKCWQLIDEAKDGNGGRF